MVLIHGYLGGARQWQSQIDWFSTRFDVIAPDLTGYGDSVDSKPCNSIDGFAQQVLDLLSTLQIERFHLLGHSMGGMIAQQMAFRATDRINRLLCYGTGPRGEMPDRFETLETSRLRLLDDGVAETAKRIAATWFTQGSAAKGYGICTELGINVSETAALAGLTAMEGWDGRHALSQISNPTLVLWGDKDRSYSWEQPYALWQGISDSNLAVMPECGHAAHLEQPEIFNAIVESFLPEK